MKDEGRRSRFFPEKTTLEKGRLRKERPYKNNQMPAPEAYTVAAGEASSKFFKVPAKLLWGIRGELPSV